MNSIEFNADTPRIIGTEMEHNNTVAIGDNPTPGVVRRISVNPLKPLFPYIANDVGLPHLGDREVYERDGSWPFLPTGDRLYVDVGNHIEFSTAEFSSAAGVVGREFTGGELLLKGAQRALADQAIADFRLYKNASGNNEFWGYHENYLGLRSLNMREGYLQPLATHIITRQVFAGAGDITPQGTFHVSQKMRAARTLDMGTASATQKRPIIDVGRDEPHAIAREWRRIHIAIGDPHLNPRSAWLQLTTTSIVARLAEAKVDLTDLVIQNPVTSAHAVSADTSLTHRLVVGTDETRHLTALEVQRELHERATTLNDRTPFPPEEQYALEVWDMVLQAIEARDEKALEWVEWMDKRELIDAFITKKSASLADPRVQAINREWANLDPEKGYGLRRARRHPIPDEVMVGYGDLSPPEGRPKLRAAVSRIAAAAVGAHGRDSLEFHIDWEYGLIGAGTGGVAAAGHMQRVWGDPYGQNEEISDDTLSYTKIWAGLGYRG